MTLLEFIRDTGAYVDGSLSSKGCVAVYLTGENRNDRRIDRLSDYAVSTRSGPVAFMVPVNNRRPDGSVILHEDT